MDGGLAKQPSRMWTRLFLYVLAAFPFLISIVFHASGQTAQTPQSTSVPPSLAFDQYLVNLGPVPVPPRPIVLAHFPFMNRGTQPAVITELIPSCGCLNPQLEKRSYEPGESGEFLLRVVTTREEPGPKEYSVRVLYQDPQPLEVELTFKGKGVGEREANLCVRWRHHRADRLPRGRIVPRVPKETEPRPARQHRFEIHYPRLEAEG